MLRAGLIAGAGLAAAPVVAGCGAGTPTRPASDPAPEPPALGDAFSGGWLFGGEYTARGGGRGLRRPGVHAGDAAAFGGRTVLGRWDPGRWEKVWIYRRHLPTRSAAGAGWRAFAEFDAVMVSAVAVLNGRTIGSHQGGYLPWSVELTRHLAPGPNVLAVMVDARNLPVPPIAPGPGAGQHRLPAAGRDLPGSRAAGGAARLPGRPVRAAHRRPHHRAGRGRAVHRGRRGPGRGRGRRADGEVTAELLDGDRGWPGPRAGQLGAGRTVTRLRLDRFGAVRLWSPDHPGCTRPGPPWRYPAAIPP